MNLYEHRAPASKHSQSQYDHGNYSAAADEGEQPSYHEQDRHDPQKHFHRPASHLIFRRPLDSTAWRLGLILFTSRGRK